MLSFVACFMEVILVTVCHSRTRKTFPFILSSMMLMFAFTSFLVLIFSLQTNYLWLTTLLVFVILLATFTCTYSMPRLPDFSPESPVTVDPSRIGDYVQADDLPIWIIVDPPPSYEAAADGLPPSYSKATACDTLQKLSETSSAPPVYFSAAEPSACLADLDLTSIFPGSTPEVSEQPIEPSLQHSSTINR